MVTNAQPGSLLKFDFCVTEAQRFADLDKLFPAFTSH